LRRTLLVLLLLTVSSLVWADAVGDPQMIVDPPPNCGPAIQVTSPFNFAASGGTGLYCFQRADSGPAWLTLDINLTGLSLHFTPSQINCLSDDFYYATPCTEVVSGGLVTDLLYTAEGPPGHPGINPGSIFQIDIRPPAGSCDLTNVANGTFCWGTGDFIATGNVPEPTSALLLVSGIGALIGKRRWLRRS
jgi:hypothetical protein